MGTKFTALLSLLWISAVCLGGCGKKDGSAGTAAVSIDGTYVGPCVNSTSGGAASVKNKIIIEGTTWTEVGSIWGVYDCGPDSAVNGPLVTTVVWTLSNSTVKNSNDSTLTNWDLTQVSAKTCSGMPAGSAPCANISTNVGKMELGVYKITDGTSLAFQNSTAQSNPPESARPTAVGAGTYPSGSSYPTASYTYTKQ